MKVLDINSAQQVSGGIDVSVSVTVAAPDTLAFINLLNAYLLGEITNATTFTDQINTASANFSSMLVDKITIGNFDITPHQ
ncbi:MAG: hypothetical protein JSS07_04625 [Proteobacteria bacterium]|nr:hypothetical protein [Pseudomonadota bacterium]